ncbi:hypothetical protein ACRAWG_35500 [Methylobacterium sp. P31]
MRHDFDLEAPATLVWLETELEPQPDLFDGPTECGPHGPEDRDHFWVAVSYVMNIDWRDSREPWVRVADRVLGPADLRNMYQERMEKGP